MKILCQKNELNLFIEKIDNKLNTIIESNNKQYDYININLNSNIKKINVLEEDIKLKSNLSELYDISDKLI